MKRITVLFILLLILNSFGQVTYGSWSDAIPIDSQPEDTVFTLDSTSINWTGPKGISVSYDDQMLCFLRGGGGLFGTTWDSLNTRWNPPTAFPSTINANITEQSPVLSGDKKRLYFVRG